MSVPEPAYQEDPSTALARHVRELLTNPQSVVALKGAGQAALKLGDAEAAGGFFARADDISPRDGQVKAGLASALTLMGQADNALRLFQEAASLGVPDGDVAGYRGLAYDLKGNQAAAQADYALALHAHPGSEEVERRLALSLAISGNQGLALRAIDPQLGRQERAAWRTRAFILALTGDVAGAQHAVQTALPGQASAFAPFLARIGNLTPAEKAAAVNLGQMPVAFQNLKTAEAAPAPVPHPAMNVKIVTKPGPVAARTEIGRAAPVAAAKVIPTPAPEAKAARFADIAALVRDLPDPAPPTARAEPREEGRATPLKKVADKVVPAKAVVAKAEPKKSDAKKSEPKKKDPKVEHPARAWVQIASGSNLSALPGEYKKLKAKAAKMLSSRTAWTASQGATNRLLVGPFKTAKEAQAFVNDLAKDKVSGFAWTSAAGQEIEKLSAK